MVDSWLTGLLDDTSLITAGRGGGPVPLRKPDPPNEAVFGSLVLPDDRLAAVDRALTTDGPVPCRVINTGGAGGLVALAGRRFDRLRPTGVRSALRDLDDLGGAAARVAMAARELDPEITVMIEVPDAPGWQRAIEAAELEGLAAAVTDRDIGVAEHLSALIEADVPFVITGPVIDPDRVIKLIMMVSALIDGDPPMEVTPEQGERIRRRLLGIEVESMPKSITALAERGWLPSH
ncbi:hypothetical protein [Microlunatus speluncae]|uniref:hypothetical protein n=1 Tax=Microlunatus speluncae TaxID=2594267 RepID=UPI001266224C|nr:hypothetical protein [Microlunatus speluncae]